MSSKSGILHTGHCFQFKLVQSDTLNDCEFKGLICGCVSTNVHFVEIMSKKDLNVRVWERGCGPTLACGTGACACVVALNKLDLCDSDVNVNLMGTRRTLYQVQLEDRVVYSADSVTDNNSIIDLIEERL